MEYIIFTLELAALFFLSRFIGRNLFRSFYNNTQNIKLSTTLIAVIYFPGVLVHEISHLLAATLLGVRVGHIEFWPSFSDGNLKLGSVRIEKTDAFRKTLIATAPVFVGTVVILGSLWTLDNFLSSSVFWYILIGVFVYQVGSTMFSSKKDLEGTAPFFLALSLLIGILWFFDFPFISDILGSGIGVFAEEMLRKASYFLAIAVGINAFIAFVIFILQNLKRG